MAIINLYIIVGYYTSVCRVFKRISIRFIFKVSSANPALIHKVNIHVISVAIWGLSPPPPSCIYSYLDG